MSQVFISHIEEEQNVAEEIARGLEQAGYTVWCDERDSYPAPIASSTGFSPTISSTPPTAASWETSHGYRSCKMSNMEYKVDKSSCSTSTCQLKKARSCDGQSR